MKKFLSLIAITAVLSFGFAVVSMATPDSTANAAAQSTTEAAEEPDSPATAVSAAPAAPAVETPAAPAEEESFHQMMKTKFIEGGWPYMLPILLCLIFGLAICIERVIYLNMATTNTERLLKNIENALNSGGLDAAKEICRNTKGPVASIFYQGLDRAHEGVELAEKSVVSYGGVQMGLLEKGLIWISLFIAMAPMLGFFGTVIGMVQAFDDIEAAGNISPQIVAGGIKVALITTVAGLIVAMILQVFYNYFVSKIDSIVNSMEDASISLIDMLVKFNAKNK